MRLRGAAMDTLRMSWMLAPEETECALMAMLIVNWLAVNGVVRS